MIAAKAGWTRDRLFAVLFPALAINAAATIGQEAIRTEGLLVATLNLWGVSAIMWLAGVAGCHLILTAPIVDGGWGPHRIRHGDPAIVLAAMAAMLIPSPAVSGCALSLVCLWVIATAPSDPLRRAALIYLCMSGSLLWGRLLLSYGSGFFLALDGWMVGNVAGTGGSGNLVSFTGSNGVFVVAPGCSSLQGISLAMVLWVTATQYHRIAMGARASITLAAMILAAISANVLRLAAIATSPANFETLHIGFGASVFGWLGLLGIVAALWIGLGNAIRA